MKFIVRYSKSPKLYSVVNFPNKDIAFKAVSKFRDDAIILSMDSTITFKQMVEGYFTRVDDLTSICNTLKTYWIQPIYGPNSYGEVKDFTCMESVLEEKLKAHYDQKGFLQTINNRLFFVKKGTKKEKYRPIPIVFISKHKPDSDSWVDVKQLEG